MTLDRKDRELIRKRRKNLIRRHDEFRRRYGMQIWLTMKMPSGRLYTYQSHPELPAPTELEISMHQPAAMRMSPSDFEAPCKKASNRVSRESDELESERENPSPPAAEAHGRSKEFPSLRLSRAADVRSERNPADGARP